jgi:hypothetical protein
MPTITAKNGHSWKAISRCTHTLNFSEQNNAPILDEVRKT